MRILLVVLLCILMYSCGENDGRVEIGNSCVEWNEFYVQGHKFECKMIEKSGIDRSE